MLNSTKLLAAAASIGFACLAYVPCSHAVDEQDFSLIQKGEHLTIAGDCAACHTAPERQALRRRAGNRDAFRQCGCREHHAGPGNGDWRLDGRGVQGGAEDGHRKGRDTSLSGNALRLLFEDDGRRRGRHLGLSVDRPAGAQPGHFEPLPFPYNIRATLWFWNLLYRPAPGWQPDPGKSAEWNRGAYSSRGRCIAAPATRRNHSLAGDTSAKFQGFSIQGWHAPNITNDKRLGLGIGLSGTSRNI